MHRRTLLLTGLVAVPAAALAAQGSAQRRPSRHRQARGRFGARHRRGGLTASGVRTRIVNRTFTSRVPINLALNSPVGLPYPSTLQIDDFTRGRILKARVTLIGLTHADPSTLWVMVVAPGNAGVILMAGAGGSTGVTGITITFDQDAAARLPDVLVSGAFQPLNDIRNLDAFNAYFPPPAPRGVTGHFLTRFNNRNPNGLWRLFTVDSNPSADPGMIAGWSLRLRVRERVRHRHPRNSAGRTGRRAKR